MRLEHLDLLSNEVFLPILSNPNNQAKWGKVPAREISERFHSFLCSAAVVCGQIKVETRKPMPPVDLNSGPSTGVKKKNISLRRSNNYMDKIGKKYSESRPRAAI